MDCELPSVSTCKTVKARKTYRCCECQHAIVKGESHEVFTGIWEGKWETYRTCVCCAKARCAMLGYLDFGDCIPFGELHERIAETGGEPEVVVTAGPEG